MPRHLVAQPEHLAQLARGVSFAGGCEEPDRPEPLAERKPCAVHSRAGADRELPPAACADIEARTRPMVGEDGALAFIGTAGGVDQFTRKADSFEEGEAASVICRDPLYRGEGDVMGVPTDWAISMVHENPKIGQSGKSEVYADRRCRN